MAAIVVFNIWVGIAFSVLQYRSALKSVPSSELESARTMGATGWQQVRDIVFPRIRGHIVSNTVLVTLATINTFGPYMLTRGGPNSKSEVLPVYIYNTALQSGELGRGAAISLALIAINLMFFFIVRRGRASRGRGRGAA
jgi:multiple sugar transport system permease protein